MAKYNVMFSVSYDIEANNVEEAVRKAEDRLNSDVNTTSARPSDVMTTVDAVEGRGTTRD
jgi:hypothetical protein